MFTISGVALITLLVIPLLPVASVRRWSLTLAARLGTALVLATLAMCAIFFVQPQAAPNGVINAVMILEGTFGLPLDTATGLPWLVLGLPIAFVGWLVLLPVHLAANLVNQAAQMQTLRERPRQAGYPLASLPNSFVTKTNGELVSEWGRSVELCGRPWSPAAKAFFPLESSNGRSSQAEQDDLLLWLEAAQAECNAK